VNAKEFYVHHYSIALGTLLLSPLNVAFPYAYIYSGGLTFRKQENFRSLFLFTSFSIK